jgi:hypothetical protein
MRGLVKCDGCDKVVAPSADESEIASINIERRERSDSNDFCKSCRVSMAAGLPCDAYAAARMFAVNGHEIISERRRRAELELAALKRRGDETPEERMAVAEPTPF